MVARMVVLVRACAPAIGGVAHCRFYLRRLRLRSITQADDAHDLRLLDRLRLRSDAFRITAQHPCVVDSAFWGSFATAIRSLWLDWLRLRGGWLRIHGAPQTFAKMARDVGSLNLDARALRPLCGSFHGARFLGLTCVSGLERFSQSLAFRSLHGELGGEAVVGRNQFVHDHHDSPKPSSRTSRIHRCTTWRHTPNRFAISRVERPSRLLSRNATKARSLGSALGGTRLTSSEAVLASSGESESP